MSVGEISIRVLTGDDVSLYRAMRGRALNEDPTAYGESANEFQSKAEESVRMALDSQINSITLGAFRDETELIGIASVYRLPRERIGHIGHVNGVFVAPEARGLGVGRRLMEQLLSVMRERLRSTQASLFVTTPQVAAKQLYLSLGFAVIGTEPRAIRHGEQFLDSEWMYLLFG